MAKKLLIIIVLLVSSFSLMAQWTCETIDPEFDNAYNVAYTYTQEKNGVLSISEYLLLGNSLIGGYYNFSSIGHDAVDYISWLLLGYVCEINGINWTDWTENEIRMKSFGLWIDSVWSGPGNIPLYLNVRGASCDEDVYCSVYSFEISFKVGETYKRYHNRDVDDMEELVDWLREDEVVVSYKYDRADKLGSYHIEWPSKEFWKDFKAASSVKFRIKHNENSDYQYYEFNMSGSTKAYNFVTANQKVCWLKDWIENKEKELEKAELQKELKEKEKQKEKEKEDAEMQREKEREEAALQKELANLTPPHELKFESTERILWLQYPNFYLYPKSDWVICDSTYLESEVFDNYDSILNILGLCPCRTFVNDILQDYSFEYYQKTLDWDLNGIQIRGKDSSEIVIPFDAISQHNWGDERFCASWDWQNCIYCFGNLVTDSLTKYQVKWSQNPLKLIITDYNKTKEYIVKDWVVDKSWQDGGWRYYCWTYNILSDDGKEYSVDFWREIEDPKSWCADCPLWKTNIGQYLLFDHWKIPSNVFFRHTELSENDYLEIIK